MLACSLHEGSLTVWNLELLDKVVHEPFSISSCVEPLVTFTLDIDLSSLRLDLGDVPHGVLAWADLIVSSREESHWHFLDLGHVDEGHFSGALEPVVGELLESIRKAIHDPVLLTLDGLALLTCVLGVIVAENAGEVSTDRLQVLIPVRAIDCVDTNGLELHDSRIGKALAPVRHVRDEARGKLHNLVDIVCMEGALEMSQTIMHLDCALRIANIEDFIAAIDLSDCTDVCCIVIEAHVSPGPVPVFGV